MMGREESIAGGGLSRYEGPSGKESIEIQRVQQGWSRVSEQKSGAG